jgi:stearoyl-CoA desaturase (delta-9 desaturase)
MKLSEFLKQANWLMIVYLSVVHIAGSVGAWYFTSSMWQTLVWFAVAYFWGGVGITGGAHRLWAHRSYSAHWIVRLFFMIGNSQASQGTIFHWVRDHRLHHKFSETSSDPHNANRGFFFSHMGWLMVKKDQAVIEAGKKIPMGDLLQDPFVTFQKKVDPWWNLTWCFVFPAVVPIYFWQENAAVAFFVCSALRYICILHATWTVNSIAHAWGYRPYDGTIKPRENFWVALWALGEGWHNWHHKYPYDYATSEFGAWINLNPTKIFIDICAFFGLVWDRKRALDAWRLAKGKLEENAKAINNVTEAAVQLQSTTNY